MNWKHIEAILRAEHRLYRCEVDGDVIVSDGHIAVAFDNNFALPKLAEPTPKSLGSLGELWHKAKTTGSTPTDHIGGIFSVGDEAWIHGVGSLWVNERYFRAFPDCSWTLPADKNAPFSIHRDGVLVALVMPMRGDKGTDCESPSDEDLFAPISSDANGWYLVSNAELQKRITKLEEDLDEKEERRDDIEAEIEEIRGAIDSLRSRRRSLAA